MDPVPEELMSRPAKGFRYAAVPVKDPEAEKSEPIAKELAGLKFPSPAPPQQEKLKLFPAALPPPARISVPPASEPIPMACPPIVMPTVRGPLLKLPRKKDVGAIVTLPLN